MAVIIRTKSVEVIDALAALGIPMKHLQEAVLVGETERDACTPNDPPGTPGYVAWSRAVRTLRDLFLPEPFNWESRNDNNLPMIVNPEKTIAIVVATGDAATGQVGPGIQQPTTKYPVGAITVEAIEENRRRQLELFPSKATPVENGAVKLTTLVLMRYRKGDKVYAELSVPLTVRSDSHVEEWAERNILEPMTLELPPMPTGGAETEEIDVPVRRRK